MSTQATLIFNPAAGQREVRAYLHTVVSDLQAHGWTIAWRETSLSLTATELAREAVAQGATVVIVAGGDGTINAAVNGLVGHPHVRLGILPTGTANVWAYKCGIAPFSLLGPDLIAAGRILREGVVLPIDLGMAGDHAFLLLSTVGFNAVVSRHVDVNIKKRVGNLAYLWAGLKQALRYRGAHITITVDGRTYRHHAWMVTISNFRLDALMAVIDITPMATSVTDGALDIGIFAGQSLLEVGQMLLRQAVNLLRGHRATELDVGFLQGHQITVEADPPLPYQVDGEPVGTTPLTVRILPRAINMIVPRATAVALNDSTQELPLLERQDLQAEQLWQPQSS